MNIRTIIAAAAILTVTACGQKKTAQAAGGAAQQMPAVRVVTAAREKVPQYGTYSTTVQAFAVNNIVPQASSRIMKVNVEVGDFVKKGEVLAEMDRAQFEQIRLQLENSGRELARLKTLCDKGGVSRSDYESAELSYEVAKTNYANLETNTILRSPLDGVVSARGYDCGDMYSMSSPIFTVQQISPVKMYVAVSEKDYSKVRVGDSVEIFPDAYEGRTFTGKVTRINPTFDSATHTVSVEVQVPNGDAALRPGMYAKARITFAVNDSVVLPDGAVVKQQGSGVRNAYVLLADGTVEQRVLSLGRHFDSKYEILSGIEAGEEVVVKGQAALRSGVKVEVLR